MPSNKKDSDTLGIELPADGAPGKNSPFAASIINVLSRNQDAGLNAGLLFDQVLKLTHFNYEQVPQSVLPKGEQITCHAAVPLVAPFLKKNYLA